MPIVQKILEAIPPAFLDSERQRYVAKVQSGHGGWSLVSLYWGLFGRGLPAGWPGLDQSDIVAEIAPCLLVRHWFCAEEPPAELLAALEHAGQELNTVALFATMLSQKLWRGTTRFDAMLEQLAQANEDSQKALQVQTALCAGDWQGASDSLAPLLKQLRVLPDEHQRIALVPLLFLQLLLGIRLDWEPHKLDDITLLPDQTSAFARFSLKPIQEYLRPLSMPARINVDLAQEKDKFAWCEYLLFAQRYRLGNMAPLPAGFDQRLLDLANFLQENTYVLAAAWLVRTLPSNDNPQYKSLLETVQQQPVCPQLWSQDIAPSRVDEFFRHCHDLFSGPETSSSATSDQTSGFFLVLLKKIEEPLLPEQAFSLQNVEPRLMSPASTSKPPQRLKSNQLHDPSIPPCFPENDRPFLNRLTVDSGSVCLPRDFWPNLCALTSLHFQYDGECSPGHLSPGRLPLLCNLAEDGKLRLQMPFQNLSLADKFILVRRDTDNWTFYHLDDKFITVKKLFRQYGDGQQLCLPASAEAKLRSLLPSLRHSFQLRGSGLPETLDGLTSADGTVELHILIHKRGDEYSLKLRNAPLPGRNLLQFPAQGELLSVVTCDGQDCLLRRDLDAEAQAVETLLEQCPTLKRLQSEKSPNQWLLTELEDVLQSLDEVHEATPAPVLEWQETKPVAIRKPGGQMQISSRQTAGGWFLDGDQPLNDERTASLAELLRNLPRREGDFLPLDDGEFLKLTDDLKAQLQSLRNATHDRQGEILLPNAALPSLEHSSRETALESLPEDIKKHLQEQQEIFASEPPVPPGLQCTLRDYQVVGFRWLARLADCGLGGCLADDMGLGKTMQTLTLLLSRADQGPSLVLAPSSVCANWQREILRFAPSLQPQLLAAGDRKAAIAQAGPRQILIGSYGLLRSLEDELSAQDWNCLILDEAQAIKNQSTRTSQAVKRLPARARFALTGTPVENHLQEFWNIFDFLNPGLLGTAQDFQQRYSRNTSGDLRRLLQPLLLRRLKTEVLTELPPKTETVRDIDMDDDERLLYDQYRRQALEKLDASGGKQMQILAALTRLRRFCCHPSLVNPELQLPGSKLQAFLELAADLKSAGHPALVFSQYTDFLQLVRDRLQQQGYSLCYLDGSLSPTARQQAIDKFQQGGTDFFLISLKAGGTGLTLTAASYVVLLDPWWNPAVESQAADRVYRIGQKNPVTVYRLILNGTVEEKIRALQDSKRQLADNILENAGDGSLTRETLLKMFEQ